MNEIETRFMSLVQKHPSGCWLWSAGKIGSGYGAFYPEPQKQVRAHRFSYDAFVGPIPVGLLVCHKCDVPACVNPEHLFVGTHLDNMRDATKKGRRSPPPNVRNNPEWEARRRAAMPKGEDNKMCRHSDDTVRKIKALRANKAGPRKIATELNLPETFVQDVIYGRARRHINHARIGE